MHKIQSFIYILSVFASQEKYVCGLHKKVVFVVVFLNVGTDPRTFQLDNLDALDSKGIDNVTKYRFCRGLV